MIPQQPYVSIIVPVYGVERYIEECAESLFSQTYGNIKYIFVDDCSPDASIEKLHAIIDKHPERKDDVIILRHDTNRGLGASRRTALDTLDTPYCTIVDSDDALRPDAIEKLMSKMLSSTANVVDGAYAEYCNGNVGAPIFPYHGDDSSHLHKVLCQNIVSNRVWGRLYKTDLLRSVHSPFIEGIDYSEDFCATARLASQMHRAWTDDVVYLYRTDNLASYTKQISHKSMLSYLRANATVYNYYKHDSRLSLPLEVGMLNVYREMWRNGIELSEADTVLNFTPRHISTLPIYALMRSRQLFPLADILYKVTRSFVGR